MTDLSKGILIYWLNPIDERDYNNLVEGIDYEIRNPNMACPNTDGSPVNFSGAPGAENYEWLLRPDGVRVGVDYRIYKENEAKRPTQIKDEEYPNYSIFITEYGVVRRDDAEIIAAIRQMESAANSSVLSEGEQNKLTMMQAAVNRAYNLKLLPLTQDLQTVEDRLIEVANKANQNARNASDLIDIVNSGGIPNLDSGWEYDNITAQGFPFNS